jgi:type I restriction enzyme, S subunit
MSSNGWEKKKLGEIATFYNGRAYKNDEFKTSGTPIVRIQNLTGQGKTVYSDLNLEKNKYIESEDLIYAWSATFGPYIWKGPKSIYHYHIWKIDCNKDILDKYYFYYKLHQISDSLKDGGNGTLFVHITKSFIENFEIKLPPLSYQKKAASILSSLDEKIELNRQTNQTLEAIAQSLFKEWFVDFNFPSATGEMQGSELGEIPKGWRVGKLGDACELVYGKALKSETRIPGKYPVVGSSGIVGTHKEYLVEAPGIVIGRKGTIGEVTWLHENFFPIDTTFYILDKLDTGHLVFHYFLLKEQDFEKITSDSAVPGLNRNQAMDNMIVIPHLELIDKFHKVTKRIFETIYNNEEQTKTLIRLRDSLLPKLMTGKIKF